jgi:membrane protease subunit HflK
MRRLFWAVLILAVVGYALSGVTLVRSGERAVVRRFGRVLEHKPEPGLWIGLPWGMDRVERVPVDRVQEITVGYRDGDDRPAPPGQVLTGDHNLVNLRVVLNFKVRPEAAGDYVAHQDRVEAILTRTAEAVLAEWAAGRTVDDVLLNAKTDLRLVLRQRTQEQLEPYGLGVEILDARVALAAPPDKVKPDFDNVARAQTQISTAVNRARQEAETRYSTALADVHRMEQTARANARNQELSARSEADTFRLRLNEYRRSQADNPNYLRQLWEEERNRLFARLRESGQIGTLDQQLGADGVDITIAPWQPPRR